MCVHGADTMQASTVMLELHQVVIYLECTGHGHSRYIHVHVPVNQLRKGFGVS